MADIKINNVAYSWAMIELASEGLTGGDTNPGNAILQGVTAIKWNRKWNVKTNYGIGGKPVNRGFGNWDYTASITMDHNTQVELRKLGNGSLTGIGEFDLTITFANKVGDQTVTSDTNDSESVTLKGCIFTEDGMEASQDDTTLTKEFDLNPFDIVVDPNVTS